MVTNDDIIPTTINQLMNLFILTTSQLTIKSLKEVSLSISISDRHKDNCYLIDNSDHILSSYICWNNVNLVDDIIDLFADSNTAHKLWTDYYKKFKSTHTPYFTFIAAYFPNSLLIRKIILSETGVQMHESQDNVNVTENSFKIILPQFITNPSSQEKENILKSLRNILQFHAIINPKIPTKIEVTHQGQLKEYWRHERVLCPFSYYQLGKYFTNDVNTFLNKHIPNINSHILPPNYRRLAKPHSICVNTCTKCRWRTFYLGCVYPPLKSGSKLFGSDLLDVNILVVGPSNTLLYTPRGAPVLLPSSWAKWGKFDVKLSNSSKESRILNSLYYVNESGAENADNSLIIIVGFELESTEKHFIDSVNSLKFLSNNLTEIFEQNANFIQTSCESLISKLIRNQSIIKSKQDESFLLRELSNAINSIIVRSTNPEVKADYLNILKCDSLKSSQDVLHTSIVDLFENHIDKLGNKSQSKDKRTNLFTPTQPKRQITDQAFDDLENFEEIDKLEESDYISLQEINTTEEPLDNFQTTEFPISPLICLRNNNFSPKEIPLNCSQNSNSLLKSPLINISCLPDFGKCSQSSGNSGFNALAELSSPNYLQNTPTQSSDPFTQEQTNEYRTISNDEIPISPFVNNVNSQSYRTDSSQDYKQLCDEDFPFSSQEKGLQKSFISNSSQIDYDELKHEL